MTYNKKLRNQYKIMIIFGISIEELLEAARRVIEAAIQLGNDANDADNGDNGNARNAVDNEDPRVPAPRPIVPAPRPIVPAPRVPPDRDLEGPNKRPKTTTK